MQHQNEHDWQVQTYTVVPRPPNVNIIPLHFIPRIKCNADGEIDKFKICLVAGGNRQIYGLDFNDTFAWICQIGTHHVIFTIAAQQDWEIIIDQLQVGVSQCKTWQGNIHAVLQFSLLFVPLVILLTYFSYLLRQTLSNQTISHYIWHICWLTSTFVPCFTLQTLCPAYLNNPQFLYKYRTQSPVFTNLFLPIQ